MAADDFVMTIDSDAEETQPEKTSKTRTQDTAGEDAQLNPDFVFDLSEDPYTAFLGEPSNLQDLVKKGSKPVHILIPIRSFQVSNSLSRNLSLWTT